MPLLNSLISMVAPHNCIVCEREGAILCAWCEPDALLPLPSQCYRCQRLTSDGATCDSCRQPQTPRHVWVATDYGETAKALVHRFKFDHARSAAPILGNAMARVLPFLEPATVIIPVPTATTRIRQRGYDHALLLARHLATIHHLTWARAVTRLTQTRQVGANREQRLRQLQQAFMVMRPGVVKGMDIVLVDDVITTGATLEAVTAVLKKAGAKSVNAIVFAHQAKKY